MNKFCNAIILSAFLFAVSCSNNSGKTTTDNTAAEPTKKEAVEYANNLAKSQDGTVLVHASKGKNKGKFMK